MTGNPLIIVLVLLPMLGALVSWLVGRVNKKARDFVVIAVTLLEAAAMVLVFLSRGECELELCGLSFTADGFRCIYGAVTAFMWLMTAMFSPEYFRSYHNRNRYYTFYLVTLGAIMGVFFSADLYTTFMFFEIMSLTSYAWVAHDETKAALRAANTYLAIAIIGGLVALMGLFLLNAEAGTLRIDELYEALKGCDKNTIYAACGCILFGFGAKAGMFPLHIWLPKAHPVAPAPASALLSGVLTKSGIFGVLVTACAILRYDALWGKIVLGLGVVTMLLGAVLALLATNIKRTLACSSMSQIGFILIGIAMQCLLGEENALAARGTLVYMVNHSLVKLVLFLCAGAVYMQCHKLELNDIRGFGKGKPVLRIAFIIGALSICGIPFAGGYAGKTLIHESIVEFSAIGGAWVSIVEWLFLIGGGITLAYMTKLYIALFHDKKSTVTENHGMTVLSKGALLISAASLVALGIWPSVTADGVASIGEGFMHGGELHHAVEYFSLENLKGVGISVAIGILLYVLVVRTLLMKKENGEKVYVNRLPAKLDLEDAVYRPLLLKVLPCTLGFIAELFGENKLLKPLCKGVVALGGLIGRAAADAFDALLLLFKKLVFNEVMPRPHVKRKFVFARLFGRLVDKFKSTKPENFDSYEEYYVSMRKTVYDTTNSITGNFSFALCMACIGICLVIVYMLIATAMAG